jgi:hypothetical protein
MIRILRLRNTPPWKFMRLGKIEPNSGVFAAVQRQTSGTEQKEWGAVV